MSFAKYTATHTKVENRGAEIAFEVFSGDELIASVVFTHEQAEEIGGHLKAAAHAQRFVEAMGALTGMMKDEPKRPRAAKKRSK